MKAEIISIGTEIMLGEITDTNASYLASRLPALGIELYRVTQVSDDIGMLVQVMQHAWQRSDIILTTGGLGPTGDDLTREAVAEMFGEVPELVPELERDLRARFGRMSIDMPSTNLKQVTLIPSARAITNRAGTAPGWWVEKEGKHLIIMPGPPREMQLMWKEEVVPNLPASNGAIILPHTLKTYGLNEGEVGQRVADMMTMTNPTLGIYAKPEGIHLRLAARAANIDEARRMILEKETILRERIGDYIWSTDDKTLEETIGTLLIETGKTLSVIEDYSGGWLAASLNDIPGSDSFFRGAVIAPSAEAAVHLGIDPDVISLYGPASRETGIALAEAVRRYFKTDFGISTTAKGEGDDYSRAITFIGFAESSGSRALSRPMRKQHVTAAALHELRIALLACRKQRGNE